VQSSYGGAAGLKRLVDRAHTQGIAVVLDVVYNHLGPEGNYFRHYGPYFTDQYRNPWGEPINFDGHGSDAVRDFFLANALLWQDEFHLDGLRLDAVPCIRDASARHVLADLAALTAEHSKRSGRPFHLIAESDLNDPRLLRRPERGGHGLAAQWSDDFHHALHAYLTGERAGYYADHGSLEHLARAYRDAYVLTGQYSHYRGRRYGAPATDRPGEQFVVFAQNHDQVGNRVRGERLGALVDFETLKLVAGLLLTAPYLPMLFMGEEYGETAPFPFFISHGDGRIIDAVRRGRKQELSAFAWHGEPPDPQDERTFHSAKLRLEQAQHGRGKTLHDWHRVLLRLRREHPALARPERGKMHVDVQEAEGLLRVRRWSGDRQVLLVCHFGTTAARRLAFPEGAWRKVLDSADPAWQGPGSEAPVEVNGSEAEGMLAPRSVILYEG
jgi:maltooligosyltrehalose trehalohydrolase